MAEEAQWQGNSQHSTKTPGAPFTLDIILNESLMVPGSPITPDAIFDEPSFPMQSFPTQHEGVGKGIPLFPTPCHCVGKPKPRGEIKKGEEVVAIFVTLLPPSLAALPRRCPSPPSATLADVSLSLSSSPPPPAVSPSSSRVPDADRTPRGAALFHRRCRVEKGFEPEPKTWSYLSFLEGIRELTLKFSGFVAGLFGDSFPFLGVDSIGGHNQVSGKGFSTTGPRVEAGNVVIHRGLHCVIGCKELFTNRHRCPEVLYIVVRLMGHVMDWNWMSMDFKVLRLGVSFGITRLIRVSFGITRLICASFGITRLICASFGITRLIGASFGITRLIRAPFGVTRLMCAFTEPLDCLCKGIARGRPTRGRKDA
ncbi:hypothetical protein E6C27_scaffold285G00080 [Cucumis melo var. makuwa]|uniref:Mucin-19-like n=1 Tax=Cucumis melo var. makuwa TaxID=1194695 RepID=A0A5A7T1D1_CUCMM|nr:hypothetical protein E6C27_scaffold285G00080 [Cucumis melo var. makuwa]